MPMLGYAVWLLPRGVPHGTVALPGCAGLTVVAFLSADQHTCTMQNPSDIALVLR